MFKKFRQSVLQRKSRERGLRGTRIGKKGCSELFYCATPLRQLQAAKPAIQFRNICCNFRMVSIHDFHRIEAIGSHFSTPTRAGPRTQRFFRVEKGKENLSSISEFHEIRISATDPKNETSRTDETIP